MIELTESEEKIFKAYVQLRSIEKVALALRKSVKTIVKAMYRFENLGLITRKGDKGPYTLLDNPYKVTRKPSGMTKTAIIYQPREGSPSGPCITRHISEYPVEEQKRMMGLFKPPTEKRPVGTIGMDVRSKQRMA
ncbi:hypothetical protein [Gorillibacterium sp. sgz5001074]|uniref:hypothetical protein n=1 Tax=Gorillibacterium sp. sgz5001074 TaxID=3446695 RepID=UPI003F664D02